MNAWYEHDNNPMKPSDLDEIKWNISIHLILPSNYASFS